ncbi:MAG: hypothetical protein IJW07_00310 [Lentisphaeria bacterium]|nr:hypothetical protein [Lentisphaeria bacterium]MBR3708947.1 hypothetical protein [Lentisphaeria bacterium]MBR4075709.1 hypothetical protein [Lentisphaeria bacterium]
MFFQIIGPVKNAACAFGFLLPLHFFLRRGDWLLFRGLFLLSASSENAA